MTLRDGEMPESAVFTPEQKQELYRCLQEQGAQDRVHPPKPIPGAQFAGLRIETKELP